MDCVVGLRTAEGILYALDIAALKDQPGLSIATGDQVTLTGLFTGAETLNNDHWQKYAIKGIVQVATVSAIDRTTVFNCKTSKTIDATFHIDGDTSVNLKLSDGRALTLPLVSTNNTAGTRYANADLAFWTKGITAGITEGKPAKETFTGCVMAGFSLPK